VQSSGEIVIVSHPPLRDCHCIMKGEFLVAIYGALTGTVAIASTIRQWWLDRAILKLEANISIVQADAMRVVLTISAVNNGRRPVRIKHVGSLLAKESVPIDMQMFWDSSELTLFGARGEKPIELSADGGQTIWNMQIKKGTQFLHHNNNKGERYGKAYVELTSGKKVFRTFLLLSDDQWPPCGVAQKQTAPNSAA